MSTPCAPVKRHFAAVTGSYHRSQTYAENGATPGEYKGLNTAAIFDGKES